MIAWPAPQTIIVCPNNPKELQVVFLNSATGVGMAQFPVMCWTCVDLTGRVPDGTKAVNLNALLIITHGSQAGTADLQVALRKHGTGFPPAGSGQTSGVDYQWQTIEPFVSGGQRTNANAWVSLSDDLKFDIWWNVPSLVPQWSVGPSYGLNIGIDAISM